MANRLYNKQVSPKGYMKGGRVNKMGGGMMMKRKPKKKGSKPDFLDLDKDKNKTESMKSAAATAKRMNLKKGSIPPQLKKFVMAKKKKAKMKNKKKVIG